MLTTPLVRLHLNCPDHGSDFYRDGKCKKCRLAVSLRKRIGDLDAENEKVLNEVEAALKDGTLITVEFSGSIMKKV